MVSFCITRMTFCLCDDHETRRARAQIVRCHHDSGKKKLLLSYVLKVLSEYSPRTSEIGRPARGYSVSPPCHLTLGALSSWSFYIFADRYIISPRQDSYSPINSCSIGGLPLNYRSDRLEFEHDDYKVLLQRNKQHSSRVSML